MKVIKIRERRNFILKNELKTEEKDIFLDSLNSLSTSSIAPRLPKKYPPISSFMIKGAVLLILLSIMIYCLSQVASSIRGYKESDELYGDMSEQWGALDTLLGSHFAVSKSDKNSHGNTTEGYGKPTLPEAPETESNDGEISATLILLRAKFAVLKETNPDVIGWITVPDTHIDYPIVHTDNNDYYLDHSITGTKLNSGAIFADYRNLGDFSDQNTVIYGHNMASGLMFANLAKFKSSSFFSKTPYIYIHTENGIYVYRVFSVYETNKYDPYIRTAFSSKNDFIEWAKSRQSASLRKVSYKFDGDEQIITLSTCTNGFGDDGRLAVHAVLTEIRK